MRVGIIGDAAPWTVVSAYYSEIPPLPGLLPRASHYPHPSPLARKIKNHVAFWNGVQVDLGMKSPV